MTLKMILGVADIPYSEPAESPKKPPKTTPKKPRKKKSFPSVTTTGQVAEILESKYGLMAAFFKLREPDIAKVLEESLSDYLDAQLSGAAPSISVFDAATTRIEEMFRDDLSMKIFDGLLPGVPTQASLTGVSHRFKNKKGVPGRPSFIDTGQFESTFKSWTQD